MKYQVQGKELILAEVTPRRLKGYCEMIGIKSFDELSNPEILVKLNKEALAISLDAEKVRRVLEICTIGDLKEIDPEDVSINAMNQIFNDFFAQLFWKSEKPGNA